MFIIMDSLLTFLAISSQLTSPKQKSFEQTRERCISWLCKVKL